MSDGAATHSTRPVTHFTLPAWCGAVSHSESTLPPLAATQDPEAPPEPPRRNLHLNQRVQWPTAEQSQPISMGARDFVLCYAPHLPITDTTATGCTAALGRSAISTATASSTPMSVSMTASRRRVNVAPQTAWYASGGIEIPLPGLDHLSPGSAAPQHARHAVSGFQPVGLSAAYSANWPGWAPRAQTPPPPPKNMGPAFYTYERSGEMPHVVHYSSRPLQRSGRP